MIVSAKRNHISQTPTDSTFDELGFRRPDWIVSISPNGLVWEIIGGGSLKDNPAVLRFDMLFPDGQQLSSTDYMQFRRVAMAYSLKLRLNNPTLSAKTHQRRHSDLLTFLMWLSLRGVRSLDFVTPDHITLYFLLAKYGQEWSIELPHRLARYFCDLSSTGANIPRMARYLKKIDRGHVYSQINSHQKDHYPFPLGAKLINWIEANAWPIAKNVRNIDALLKAAKIIPSAMTSPAIERTIVPIEELYLWRQDLPAGISFVPFAKGATVAARAVGEDVQKTKTIPPKNAFSFLTLAAKFVLDVAPIANHLRGSEIDIAECERQLLALGLKINIREFGWKISQMTQQISPEGLDRLLSAACFAVIAGLTARRKEEIIDLGAGCVATDEEGNAWLTIWIEKTLQRYDLIPVPALVVHAVRVLEDISAKSRKISGKDSLWLCNSNDKTFKLEPNKYLNDLAFFGGLWGEEKSQWTFKAHEFRRFFAMLYYWRYEPGELGALSHHLRHFDLEMTKRYIQDQDGKRIFLEIGQQWRASVLREIALGARDISGAAGNRIKTALHILMKRFRNTVDVVAVDKAVNKLIAISNRLGSEFRQHVWGTICVCPTNTKFSMHAKCKGGKAVGPDYSNASEFTCGGCAFAMQTDRFKASAVATLQNNQADSTTDSLLAEFRGIQIISLQTAISRADSAVITQRVEQI